MMENNTYKARWVIIERYYGKFDYERIIGGTDNILDAGTICDAFLKLNKGRPFNYRVKKIDDSYQEINDNLIYENVLVSKKVDLSIYLNGIDAL